MRYWLVVSNMFYDFPIILGIIIPTDFHSMIFQRRRDWNHQPVVVFVTESSTMFFCGLWLEFTHFFGSSLKKIRGNLNYGKP